MCTRCASLLRAVLGVLSAVAHGVGRGGPWPVAMPLAEALSTTHELSGATVNHNTIYASLILSFNVSILV